MNEIPHCSACGFPAREAGNGGLCRKCKRTRENEARKRKKRLARLRAAYGATS